METTRGAPEAYTPKPLAERILRSRRAREAEAESEDAKAHSLGQELGILAPLVETAPIQQLP